MPLALYQEMILRKMPCLTVQWGIAGYFKDPGGHLFEVDYEQAWVFDAGHRLAVDHINA